MDLNIDKKRDKLLEEYSVGMLKDFYLTEYEKSPQEGFARASLAWSKYDGKVDKELAQRLYDYVSNKWFMFASPVLSNAPNGQETKSKGMPISCFLTYVPDTLEGLIGHSSELRWLSIMGGGVGGHWSDVRTVSDIAPGPMPFLHTVDADMIAYRQGKTRKGSYAAYMNIDHPDIMEFLEIGTEGNPIQELTHGVTVKDDWMQQMIDGDVDKRTVWAKVLQSRGEMGYPYIFFTDNANNGAADVYKDKNLPIYASNLCTEIMLPSNHDWSFVCVLSSINVLHYDKWKDTDAVETMIYFLDAVITEFLEKLEVYKNSEDRDDQQTFLFMERAYNFSKENRALGMGVLGWHSLLQSKMLPFDSQGAYDLNSEVFKNLKEHSNKASKDLAEKLGEPELLKGYGRRNTTLNAVAPTTSSAFILGQVSQGIEPIWSNIYVKDIAKIKTTIKNPFLVNLLEEKGMDTPEVWKQIRDRDGSVQDLDFLSEEEKEVFKTYAEIDQMSIIYQAANRQNHIDQGQSLNIIIHPDTTTKEVNKIHVTAWKLGLKSLYYQHSMNAAQKFKQKKECESCEG